MGTYRLKSCGKRVNVEASAEGVWGLFEDGSDAVWLGSEATAADWLAANAVKE